MSLPEGWREITLGDVTIKITKGSTPTKKEGGFSTSGINFIKAESITDEGEFIQSKFVYITNEIHTKYKRSQLEENDILFSIAGVLGRVSFVTKDILPVNTNQALALIRINEKVFPLFIFYYLKQREIHYFVNNSTSQSAQPNINLEQVGNLEINLPPLQEQKEIASILSSFDKKIKLLKEQNETLEQMAQRVFREWFVDIKTTPTDWKVYQLKDISEKISKGTTPRKIDVEGLESTIPFLKVKDITDNGNIKVSSLEKIPNEVHEKALKRSILEKNDILYSIAGTIGRVTILPKELDNINCNQAVAFIRLKNKDSLLEYVHQWIQSRNIKAKIESSIVQGVQANVSLGTLGDLKISIPDNDMLAKWNVIAQPIYYKITNNNNQIQTLQKTRDTLLPRLMSGEVRVYL